MTVYADVLFLVNLIVDYFLLRLTAIFLHLHPPLWRQMLSSVIGGIFSLYIFVPQTHFLAEISVHILMCFILSLIAFGFGSKKTFFSCSAVLFAVNFAYSGAMLALWLLLKPNGMVINNSVVYFNVSPLFLITFSVVGYFLTVFIRSLLQKKFPHYANCSLVFSINGSNFAAEGIVDTGNSLKDSFGMGEIVIISSKLAEKIMETQEKEELKCRYRAIPCATVTGTEILDGYRIDTTKIFYNNKRRTLKNVVVAISKSPLCDCEAIINPESVSLWG